MTRKSEFFILYHFVSDSGLWIPVFKLHVFFVEQKLTRRGRKPRAKTDEMFEYQEEKIVTCESESLLSFSFCTKITTRIEYSVSIRMVLQCKIIYSFGYCLVGYNVNRATLYFSGRCRTAIGS